tara:strand:+ start:574 stop:699 length:126 start_codon:yes stop_codon:yes gene_type:complete
MTKTFEVASFKARFFTGESSAIFIVKNVEHRVNMTFQRVDF